MIPSLSPFAVRGYRLQWLADLLTSWAFEMETVILGWYIAVTTQSVLLVTLFGSLQFMGTLLAPFLGLAGDRLGHRRVLSLMRASFMTIAAVIALLSLAGGLTPTLALVLAGLAGLVRPSDAGMRNVLIGEVIPPEGLMGAISLSRITTDSARIAGALAGAGIVALLGMGDAYLIVVAFYAGGALCTLGAGAPRLAPPGPARSTSPLREMAEAAGAVWRAPAQRAVMLLAFIINVTAYPFTLGLLPYVAQDVYGTDQVGLGYLVAAVASGGMAASILLGLLGPRVEPARLVIAASLAWHGLVIVFGQVESLAGGLLLLPVIGLTQMLCILPMAVLLLRGAPAALRGRIMGLRTLAVYGLPMGLLGTGPLIAHLGFTATTALYGALGSLATLLLLLAFRSAIWPPRA